MTRISECRLEIVKDDVNEKPVTNDTMIRGPRDTVWQLHRQYADVGHNHNKCDQQNNQHDKYLCIQKISAIIILHVETTPMYHKNLKLHFALPKTS